MTSISGEEKSQWRINDEKDKWKVEDQLKREEEQEIDREHLREEQFLIEQQMEDKVREEEQSKEAEERLQDCDNEEETLVQQPEYNKLKMRPAVEPALAVEAAQSCSPITLEYAEELLSMASQGSCNVMDVSQIPKECPSGKQILINCLKHSLFWVRVLPEALKIT